MYDRTSGEIVERVNVLVNYRTSAEAIRKQNQEMLQGVYQEAVHLLKEAADPLGQWHRIAHVREERDGAFPGINRVLIAIGDRLVVLELLIDGMLCAASYKNASEGHEQVPVVIWPRHLTGVVPRRIDRLIRITQAGIQNGLGFQTFLVLQADNDAVLSVPFVDAVACILDDVVSRTGKHVEALERKLRG